MASPKSFAEAALELYKGKVVEVNTGETRTALQFSDFSSYQKSLIRGKVVNAVGDGLVLECLCGGDTHQVLVNCWSVTAITEIKDGRSLTDFYVDEFQKNYKR